MGFRFTAERVAASLGISGWVKNLRDGRVEIVCEASESVLKEFLHKIDGAFKDYIRDSDIEWGQATGEFSNFDIEYD